MPHQFTTSYVKDSIDLFRYYKKLRSEEHTSELQSRLHLVCRLLLEKKKKKTHAFTIPQYPQRDIPYQPGFGASCPSRPSGFGVCMMHLLPSCATSDVCHARVAAVQR